MHNIDSTKPSIRYTARGKREELTCDLIAGCDAFHGICRPAPGNAVRFYDKTYPFGWLGILAEAPPSSEALVYTYHEVRLCFVQHEFAKDYTFVFSGAAR